MTVQGEPMEELAHRTCSRYKHDGDPGKVEYTFHRHTLADFARALQQPLWRQMKAAPIDGQAVLALVEGSDIPRAVRWRNADDPRADCGAGWYMTWDDTFVWPHDGPRYWMPCPSDPDASATPAGQPEPGLLRTFLGAADQAGITHLPASFSTDLAAAAPIAALHAIRIAAANVVQAFEDLGRTKHALTLLQARGRCEVAMLKLNDALKACTESS